jgi:DNA topoisomerase-1
MRTDSKKYSQEFIDCVKKYVVSNYDNSYINKNIYDLVLGKEKEKDDTKLIKSKKKKVPDILVQQAHESIRPTNIFLSTIDTLTCPREKRMYKLIWETTLESCMSECINNVLSASISASNQARYLYTSEINHFPGWKIVSKKYTTENKEFIYLYTLQQNSLITFKKIHSKTTIKGSKQHYTEAKLVQLLEEQGIGRPSTFSSLIDKIQERGYVKKENIKITFKNFITFYLTLKFFYKFLV